MVYYYEAQKKLKATPNAVDLAMNLLLSSQARKHTGESAYHQFKTTNLRQHQSHRKKVKDFTRRLLFDEIYMMQAE